MFYRAARSWTTTKEKDEARGRRVGRLGSDARPAQSGLSSLPVLKLGDFGARRALAARRDIDGGGGGGGGGDDARQA